MSAADDLIDRFMAVFGEPKTVDVDKFLDEYAKALRGLDARVLEKAGDTIIKRSTFWPRPAEVYAEAEKAAAVLYAARGRDEFKTYRKEPTPEEKARVRAMCEEFFAERVTQAKPERRSDEWADVTRDAFERMQRRSQSWMHGGLSDTSRRMTGEKDE